jgi:uncharacterized damage-inducible protein DinB
MHRYDFLLESYRTERLKTLSVWSMVSDANMGFRLEPRARTPHEHMVHQCVSEDAWMRGMLGIDTGVAALPTTETRLDFLRHYADVSTRRLMLLEAQPESWFEEPTTFFDEERSRAWVITRRLTHSAHHRGQLTTCLRLLGADLYSTYGPTADTGGLFQNNAPVIYRYPTIEALLEGEAAGGVFPPLPGPGANSPTERPGLDAT